MCVKFCSSSNSSQLSAATVLWLLWFLFELSIFFCVFCVISIFELSTFLHHSNYLSRPCLFFIVIDWFTLHFCIDDTTFYFASSFFHCGHMAHISVMLACNLLFIICNIWFLNSSLGIFCLSFFFLMRSFFNIFWF